MTWSDESGAQGAPDGRGAASGGAATTGAEANGGARGTTGGGQAQGAATTPTGRGAATGEAVGTPGGDLLRRELPAQRPATSNEGRAAASSGRTRDPRARLGARGAVDPASDPALRMGGVALKNGLILLTERNWAAAIREADGSISVASGKKPRLPGSGETAGEGLGRGGVSWGGAATRGEAVARGEAATGGGAALSGEVTGAMTGATGRGRGTGSGARSAGIPLVRGLGRFGESLLVLATVKDKLPNAELPFEGGRIAAALGASMAATSAVRSAAPKSAVVQEIGTALAAFVPAVLAVKNSAISGYHGAEHKVIGGREAALRAAAWAGRGAIGPAAGAAVGDTAGATGGAAAGATAGAARAGDAEADVIDLSAVTVGDSAAATKEHDRCGSNLVGPYLIATILTNLLARGRSGNKTPAAQAAAGAASLGLALEALRWTSTHADSRLARLMLAPGKAIQKRLTTTEPTPEQLEVGERALEELLRLERAGA